MMRRGLSLLMGSWLMMWLCMQGCFLSAPSPCNRFDPGFDQAQCPCTSQDQCPTGQQCVSGRCTSRSDGTIETDGAPGEKSDEPISRPDVPQPPDVARERPPPPDETQDQPEQVGPEPPDVQPICRAGETRPCYPDPANPNEQGECKAGTQSCTLDRWGPCVGAVAPTAEVCDGKDNDCNGKVDESDDGSGVMQQACYTGPAGTKDIGICKAGTQVCNAGKWGPCSGQVLPKAEACDKLDDNCDGKVDNKAGGCNCTPGTTRQCYAGKAGTEGVADCKGGTQVCNAGQWGPCNGQVLPQPETCDDKDNDCDGKVDEFDMPCKSDCGSGTQRCTKGKLGQCSAPQPQPEVCDNKDNDCNGQIDDMGTEDCYSGPAGTSQYGACRAGTRTCSNGQWSACTGEIKPSSERCNGIDDDCNGDIDDNNACGRCPSAGSTRNCGTSRGPCSTGTQTCDTLGFWGACRNATGAKAEICNGIDDDCNGQIDDGLTATKRREYFLAVKGNKADYLFVVDNSSSMQSERRTLAQATSAFLGQLQQLNADYHIGVIHQDTAERGYLVGNTKIVTSQTNNAASVLSSNIQNGGTGSPISQRAFYAAQEALSPPTSTNQNQGFLRQDAALTLLFVSDDYENSLTPVSSFATFFQSLKGNNANTLLRAYAITPSRTGCISILGRCPRYHDMVGMLGGDTLNIYNASTSDVANFLSQMARLTAGGTNYFRLSYPADVSTIMVTVNNQSVSQSNTNGWQYDSNNRILSFVGAATPQAGQLVTVSYQQFCRP